MSYIELLSRFVVKNRFKTRFKKLRVEKYIAFINYSYEFLINDCFIVGSLIQ